MDQVGELARDLRPGDRIICNDDGSYWLSVLAVRQSTPHCVDVTTHLRTRPGGPHHVMYYAPDDRVDIVRL